ncbi:ABC transporter ATP-binding protein [Aneurinibacillus sp. BA2021]|nr:ABC transporter ATP-binding protein [Aneurinibacillus sp. BA2021]
MKENIIEFQMVSKKLGNNNIVSDINLTVEKGDIIGIIGSNGSGKTTLLRLCSGLIYPDKGKVIVNGKVIKPGLFGTLPTSIGTLIETPSFLPHFSGLKNLKMLAEIQSKIKEEDIRKAIEKVGLNPDNRKTVKTYSLGMRQRLGIAQAIMEKPDILLFDEPTNGLDDSGIKMFADLIQEQVNRGAAIIIVSHVKEEVSRFCDKVFMIQNGKLELVRSNREKKWIVLLNKLEDLETLNQELPNFNMTKRINGYLAGICMGEWDSKEEFISILEDKGIYPADVKEVR